MDPEKLAALFQGLQESINKVAGDVAGLKASPPPPAPAPPAPVPPPAAPPVKPEDNALALEQKRIIADLTGQVTAMAKKTEESEAKAIAAQRATAINNILADFAFVAPSARQAAYSGIDAAVKVAEDGSFLAGDNLPLAAFAKNFLTEEHSYMLAPANVAGSGLTPSGGQAIGRGGQVDLAEITPNMTPETRARATAAITAALPKP